MGVNMSRISFLLRNLSEQRKTRTHAIGRNERDESSYKLRAASTCYKKCY